MEYDLKHGYRDIMGYTLLAIKHGTANSPINERFIAGKIIKLCSWWIFQQATFDDTGGYNMGYNNMGYYHLYDLELRAVSHCSQG
jgi:hypothetical protein